MTLLTAKAMAASATTAKRRAAVNFIERFVVDRRRLGANCADEQVSICAFMKGREIRTPELHSLSFLWHGIAFESGLRQTVQEEEHMRHAHVTTLG